MAPTHNVSTGISALSKLRSVDVCKGEGVWVLPGEGCISCCRGRAWALNAGDQFEKLGLYPKW
eukprot:4760745-Pyramimonas_sp.AAC.1